MILTNEQLYGMWDSVVEQADGWIDETDEVRERQYVDTWCVVEYNNEKYNIFIDLEVKGCYYKNRQLLEKNIIITHIWLAPEKTSKSPELIYGEINYNVLFRGHKVI